MYVINKILESQYKKGEGEKKNDCCISANRKNAHSIKANKFCRYLANVINYIEKLIYSKVSLPQNEIHYYIILNNREGNATYRKIFRGQRDIVRKKHLINITSRMPNSQNNSIIFPLLVARLLSASCIRYSDTNDSSILYNKIIDSLPKLDDYLRIYERKKGIEYDIRNRDLSTHI